MPTIEDTTWIDAPIEGVSEYLPSPESHVDVVPSFEKGTEEGDLPVGGTEGAFTFEMLGMSLDGHFRDVEFDPPDRRVYRHEGDIEGTTTYDLRSEDGGSRVDVRNQTEPPGLEFVEKLTDPLVARYLAREIESTLGNVKMIVEDTRAGGDMTPMYTSYRLHRIGSAVP